MWPSIAKKKKKKKKWLKTGGNGPEVDSGLQALNHHVKKQGCLDLAISVNSFTVKIGPE